MSQDAAWLPSEIAEQLTELRSWVRWQWLLRGAGRVGMMASLGLAGAFLADDRYDLAPTTRMAVLASIVTLTTLAFLVWVVVPLCRRIGWAELAAMADKANPRWEDALTSAVELFDPDHPDSFKGSAVMRELLLKQTRQRIDELDLEEVVSSRKAWSSVRWGLASCLMLAIPVFVAPSMYRQLWQRFLMPWGNWGTAGAWTVVVENGDRIVARGTDVELLATAEKDKQAEPPKSLTLEWRDSAGTADRRAMPFVEARKSFVAVVPHVMRDFDFRIVVERQKSRDYKVQVVEPPVVTKIRLDVEPPAYAGWPAQSLDGAIGAIKVFEKSRLKFTLEFNKPVETAQLVWRQHGDANKKLDLAASKQTASLELTADPMVAGPFLFAIEDIHKLPNNDTVPRELVIITDEPPKLTVQGDHSTEARPDDVVPIDVTASDDVGLGTLELHLKIEEKPREPVVVEAVRGQKEFEHRFTLDLSQLNVEHGQWLNYRVRITDERPEPGPHEVWSEPRVLRISKKAAPPGANELAKTHEQLRDELNDLRRDIDAKKNDLAKLRKESLPVKKQDDPPDSEHVAQRQRELHTLIERAEKLAEQLAKDPLFHELGEKADQVAQNELAKAEAEVQQARNDADKNLTPEQRNHVREAEVQLEAASKKLAQLEKPFEQLADLQKDLLELRRLARQAEQLANRADELAKADPANQPEAPARDEKQVAADAAKAKTEKQQLAEQQKQLADALNDLLKRRPELLNAARRDQLEQLAELAEDAKQLAEQQQQLADALRQQQEATAERNAELAAKQEDLQKRADANVEKATAAKPTGEEPNADAPKPEKPATPKALKDAVVALQKGDLAEAQKQQEAAANELDRLAAELQKAKAEAAKPNESPLGQVARELANEQKKLAEKTAEAAKSDDADARQQAAEQLNREQAALNERIGNLPEPNKPADAAKNKPADPNGDPPNDNKPNNAAKLNAAEAARQQVEQRAEQAQQALKDGDLNKAVEQQKHAEQALRDLARRADQQQNDANKPLPQRAQELANAQKQLADKAAEAAKGDDADQRQRAAEQLQREQAALNERIENLPQNPAAENPVGENNPAEPNAAQAARQAAEQRGKQAAQALADGNLEQAAQEQRRAEQALRELAQQAAQQPMPNAQANAEQGNNAPMPNGNMPPENEPLNEANRDPVAQQLAQLAEEQRRLAQEVTQALNEQRGEQPQQNVGQVKNLPHKQPNAAQPQENPGQNPQAQHAGQNQQPQATQRELARQAQELQRQVQQELGREAPEVRQAQAAAQQAQASQQRADNGQFPQAAERGEQAANAAEQLAEQLQNNPRANPELAQQANELAERQQEVAQQMEQLGQQPQAANAAQQQRQQELNNAARELGQQLAKSQQRLGQQPLNQQQAAQGARQAQQQAENGQQNMQAAQQQARQGNANQAAQSAEQAAENLQQAAQQAQAAAERNRPPQSPVPHGVGEDVAEAAERLRQAQQAQQEANQQAQASPQNGQPMPGNQPGQQGQSGPQPGQPGQQSSSQQASAQGKGQGQSGQGQSSQGQSQGQSGQGQAQGQGQGQSAQAGQGQSSGQGQQGQSQGQGQGQSQGQGRGQGQAPGQGQGAPSSADGQTADAPQVKAARQLRAAARALSDAANQSAPLPSQGGQPQPGKPINDPNGGNQIAQAGGGGSGQGNLEQDRGENLGDLPTQLKNMTGRNWGQLSSKLKTELSQQAKHQAHGDYSKLIKLYFQEIAKTPPEAKR